jgi:endonuclease G
MRVKALLCASAILSCSLGCAVHQQLHTRAAIGSRYVAREAGLTPQQKQLASDLCFKGMPQKTSDQLGPTEFIFRQGYVLEFSSLDKIPLWVCEHVTANQLGTKTDRSNKFMADPNLKGPRSTPADYARSSYDRGHQAPAADQGRSQELQNETFYMSNMAPQLPRLNRDAWKSLEELTRKWVAAYSEAYEFTGPLFYDPKEDDRRTADGTIQYRTIGKDAVSVPTHFYKIVIVKDGAAWKSIAFVMPNVSTYKSPYHLEQYIRSVSWIEQHTGLNFMPGLSAQQAQNLEAHASPMW